MPKGHPMAEMRPQDAGAKPKRPFRADGPQARRRTILSVPAGVAQVR